MTVPNKELEEKEVEIIKELIDKYDLPAVLFAVESVCHDKIEYITSRWPFLVYYRVWANAAEKIETLINELYTMQIHSDMSDEIEK